MNFFDIIAIGISLSMDAFAVSTCKGLSIGKVKIKHCLTAGIYFGIFQALMPLTGYFIASTFASKIASYSAFIAFGLLLLIGGNMVREAIFGEDDSADSSMTFMSMVPLAVATSIDALAVGVSFGVETLQLSIYSAVAVIGITTFVISSVGVAIGSYIGSKFRKVASVTGGVVLIAIGVKFLLEGLGVL